MRNIKTIGIVDTALASDGHFIYLMKSLSILLKDSFRVTIFDFDNTIKKSEIDFGNLSIINLTNCLPKKSKQYSIKESLMQIVRSQDIIIFPTFRRSSLNFIKRVNLKPRQVIPIIHTMKIFEYSLFKCLINSTHRDRYRFTKYYSIMKKRIVFNDGQKTFIDKIYNTPENTFVLPYKMLNIKDICNDNRNKLNEEFTVCILGRLTKGKEIKFCLNILKEMNCVQCIVKGANEGYFEEEIEQRKYQSSNILLNIGNISDEDYTATIQVSHFTLIPLNIKYERYLQNTGLVFDSLIHKRPIIGPDISPLKEIVLKYKIGLLYKYNDINSFKNTILQAKEVGVDYFYDNIILYLKENSIENISYNSTKFLVKD